MHTRILVWARRVAAVLIFLLAGGAAPAAGLLAPWSTTLISTKFPLNFAVMVIGESNGEYLVAFSSS
jgi:hypothetical protein